MKEYGDERFIYKMATERETTPEKPNDIRNSAAVICGKTVAFDERSFFDGRLHMIIPSDFEIMPLELAKIKYPNENRPAVILSDERGSTTINFTLREEMLDKEETEDVKDALQRLIIKMNPSYKIITSTVIKEEGIHIGYFDFVSPTINDDVYNLMFIFPLNERLVLGSFNCLHVDMAGWLDVTEQMLRSIRVS